MHDTVINSVANVFHCLGPIIKFYWGPVKLYFQITIIEPSVHHQVSPAEVQIYQNFLEPSNRGRKPMKNPCERGGMKRCRG